MGFTSAEIKKFSTASLITRCTNDIQQVQMLIMNGVSVLIVWVGSHGVDSGTIQVGDLTTFITYSMVIIMGFLMLSMVSIMLPRAGVAADIAQNGSNVSAASASGCPSPSTPASSSLTTPSRPWTTKQTPPSAER